MITALWTSASGLLSQQVAVDAISNNIANVDTTGYKKNTTQFQDLFYRRANSLGEFEPETSSRTGISIGTGVRISATQKLFDQGRLEQTDNPLDLAIDGEGFFRVLMADGTPAYTRDGGFHVDKSGQLMTPQGYRLDPAIKIPEGASGITVYPDGKVSVATKTGELKEVGRITLFKADNPNGLLAIGENLFLPTVAVGKMVEKVPASDGVGSLDRGFVEGSNVDLADEMTQLVIAQRAYQLNSRALKSADDMLGIATNIRG